MAKRARFFGRKFSMDTDGDVVTPDGECVEPELPSKDPVLVELLLESEELLNRLSFGSSSWVRSDAAKLSGRIGRTLESLGT
jgi:hypothetical protein